MLHGVENWDDAYSNGANIPGGERWPAAWVEPARRFRERADAVLDIAYGPHERERLDLFRPAGGEARGLVVFVHGGFWIRLDKSYWSHLARGAVERGWAVAIPSYTLAPEARVAAISRQVARAVAHVAATVEGPVVLAGHSAGGQIVARLACADDPAGLGARLRRVVSISGLHDLRPLLNLAMNADIRLDAAEVARESPALLSPVPGLELVCWVGAAERAEFVRQNDLLANVWRGLGARTASVHEPDRHHFSVIDGLARADSPLVDAMLR